MPRQAVQLRARLGPPQLAEPRPAAPDDRRNAGRGLYVVHQRRLSPEALLGGERRLQPGHPPLTRKRLQEGGLFAADVGPVTGHDVPAKLRGGLGGLFQRAIQRAALGCELAADVDVDLARLGDVGRDGQTLEQLVGLAQQHLAVLERSGLALVGVAHDVALSLGLSPQRAPLEVRGKARPAAPL